MNRCEVCGNPTPKNQLNNGECVKCATEINLGGRSAIDEMKYQIEIDKMCEEYGIDFSEVNDEY